jgi:nucleoside-diphosphate-sugar epimerase
VRVVVLGGTGFLGHHIVRALAARGDSVCVFHRGATERGESARVVHLHDEFASLPDRMDAIRAFGPEVVIDTVPFHDKSGHGVVHFEGVADRAVVITSADVYRAFARVWGSEPGLPDAVPLTEESPLREKPSPDLGEEIDFDNVEVERAAAQSPLPVTVIRAPVIFGPHDPFHRLYRYIKRMEDGRPAIVIDARLASWRWSRGYVENVADAVVLAAVSRTAEGRTYNVAPAETLTEQQWIEAIAEAHSWGGEVVAVQPQALPEHLRAAFDTDQHVVLDSTRIRSELGYAETVPLRDALQRTVEWERANPPSSPPSGLDYEAEDALLARLRTVSEPPE